MKTVKNNFPFVGTQKGHVYVKMNKFYTATVRNLAEFVQLMNSDESKELLEIIEVSGVSESFAAGVEDIIEQYKAEPIEGIKTAVKVEMTNDKEIYYNDHLDTQNDVEFWTCGVQVTHDEAEKVFDMFHDFVQNNMNRLFDYPIECAMCPAESEGEYYDYFAASANDFLKRDFIKQFRAAVKEFKARHK